MDGMIGLEASVEEWVAAMVEVGREVRRVLRSDGTFWLNLGDKYAGSGGAGGDYNEGGLKAGQTGGPAASPVRFKGHATSDANRPPRKLSQQGDLKPKDLMGLPWRVAFALQADGWWLRSDIVWAKPNPMPQSVTDRPTTAHEYVFLLTKAAHYYYDNEAVREAATDTGRENGREGRRDSQDVRAHPPGSQPHALARLDYSTRGRNKRSVWHIPTEPFPGDHYATFPSKLVEPCIRAGTSEHGVCPECGAPWERVVERMQPPPDVFSKTQSPSDPSTNRGFDSDGVKRGSGQKYQNWLNAHPALTTGWRPTCAHSYENGGFASREDAAPVPATVLDPFSGAGTTGLVAQRLGRDYIGIELNPDYVAMSRKRIADDLLTEADHRIAAGQTTLFDLEAVGR